MTRASIASISPVFVVAEVPATLSFYRDMLGFEVTFRGPGPEDEFFGIVRRDGAMIMVKALGAISEGKEISVQPIPNYSRKPAFSWDAYLEVPFSVSLTDRGDDGVRGFVIKDIDGYGLFFGNHRA